MVGRSVGGTGFYDECKRRYNVKVWKLFNDCFNCLPFVAIVEEKIICMHGGLSPSLSNMDQLRQIRRPTVRVQLIGHARNNM